jgi:hypothetical protein
MTLTIPALLVTIIVSYLTPILTGLLTRIDASASTKQFVAAVLSAVTGLVASSTLADGTAVFSTSTLTLAAIAFLANQTAYLGLYRPHGANSYLLPNIGIVK